MGIFGALGNGTFHDQQEFQTVPQSFFMDPSQSPKSIKRHDRALGNDDHHIATAAAGFGHSVVLTKGGDLFLFGRAYDIKTTMRMYGLYTFSGFLARVASNYTLNDETQRGDLLLQPSQLCSVGRKKFFKKASCSGGLTSVLTADGNIFCFGINKFGQCGTGEVSDVHWIPSVSVGAPFALDVDVGLQHGICLCSEGEVYTWGKGKNGQLGSNDESEVNAHTIRVPLSQPAVAVGAGFNHCAVVCTDGNIYLWGKRMSSDLIENTKSTYKDQLFPKRMSLPDSRRAVDVYCSSFATVVKADDDSLWIMGVDEANRNVSLDFQPVYAALEYTQGTYTMEELEALPRDLFSSKGCVVKKGYHAVSVISPCKTKVYDISLQHGVARLFEVVLEPREKGQILDYSAGFRHTLLVTE